MRNKSILMIGNFLSRVGGARGPDEDLANYFSEAGWSVIAASDKLRRFERLLDMVSTTWRRRTEYSVAHVGVFSGPAFLWAEVTCAILRIINKPFALRLHGGNLPAFARVNPKRVRRLFKAAKAITAPSHYMHQEMLPFCGSLHLLPYPIELSKYEFNLRKKPKPRLVWLRSFNEIYNPTIAPHIIALLKEEFPSIHLTMIGPDKGDKSLQKVYRLISELGLEEHMSIVEGISKEKVPQYISKHDIFLNTTRYESFGVSLMEAGAAGLCLISTNVGAIPSLWRDEVDALLVPPDDAKAMANAVRRVLMEQDLAERISRNARKNAELYDNAVLLPKWEALLTSVMDDDNCAPSNTEQDHLLGINTHIK